MGKYNTHTTILTEKINYVLVQFGVTMFRERTHFYFT